MKRLIFVLIAVMTFMNMAGPEICFAEEPVFSISAENNADTASSLISISLAGKNLNDLYAYEAVLSYDSEKLELVRTVSEINGFSVSPKTEGNKIYIAFTKVGNVNGESGDLKLTTIIFRGKETGKAKIRLESVKTVNSELTSRKFRPNREITVSVRKISLVLEPEMNKETGAATAVLSTGQIESLFSETKSDLSRVRTAEIEILKAEGAREYVIKFPVQALSDPLLKNDFIIRTPLGMLRVPCNMLMKDTVINGEYVSIGIGIPDTGKFSNTLKGLIGNRPVITLKADVDGKTVTQINPRAAIRVTVPYRPVLEEAVDSEHIVALLIDDRGDVKPVETGVYNDQRKTVSFVVNYFGTFAVSFVKKTFDDIRGHWSQKYVEVMASRGIIKGFPNNIYGYQHEITRADYVTLLIRMLGMSDTVESNFDDVLPGDYFYQTVGIARKTGIVNSDENLFRPREPVTREEMMMFTAAALRYVMSETEEANFEVLNEFSDVDMVSPEALESAAVLAGKKIIVGAGGKLMPKEKMTRAEAAAVLYRLFKTIWNE